MADKRVNITSAREIMAKHAKDNAEKATASWPKKCATSQILFRNAKGDVVETDLHVSIEINEDGQFNTDTRNPVVIHNAPDGFPQHEYCFVMVKDQRSRIRPWMDKLVSAMAEGFFDIQTPPVDAPAEEAKEGLGSPTASPQVEMPT